MRTHKVLSFLFTLLLGATAVAAQCMPASTAAGALDTCFDADGKQTANLSPNQDSAYGVTVQPDGKILVAGFSNRQTSTSINSDIALLRYNADGSPDTTFGGGDGIVITDGGASLRDEAEAVTLQPDGKILVCGLTQISQPDHDLIVVRYNPDGSLDTTFDGDGRAIFSRPTHAETALDLVVQPNGKILAVGFSFLTSYTGFAVRFNANGSLDTSFGTNGSKLLAEMNLLDDIALQPDGKIILAGGTAGDHGSGTRLAVARMENNGALDAGFGTAGITSFGTSNVTDRAKAVLLEPNGKIVAGGYSYTVSTAVQPCGTMVRFSASGVLENSFVNCAEQPSAMAIYAIARQSDGKLLSAGLGAAMPSQAFQIIRYNPDLTLDTTFNGSGVVRLRFSESPNQESTVAFAITRQGDNRIIAAGISDDHTSGIGALALARIMPGFVASAAPFDFDGDSKTDISIFRPSMGEWWYQKSSDGSSYAAQFGASPDKPTPADLTGDGKTDIAFWRPSTGEWFILRSEDFSYFSFPFGTSGDVPQVGDFDVDGKADASVFRPSNSTWFIQRSSDGGAEAHQFGVNGDVPVAADYDADGETDLAVFRPSTGQWWLNRSTAGAIVFTFGAATDKLVPGDYTGDAKTDVALWRPATGEWFILRSEDQSYYSFPFGVSTDLPAPGDFDGDGKWDATVFRPSTATWFVQRTTAGTLIQTFGQTGDRPVPNAFVP